MESQDTSCIFCKRAPESISHLFFKCTFVNSIWRRIRSWLNVQRSMSTLHSAVKWIKKDFGGAFIHSKVVVLAFAATAYTIWASRNKVLFAGKSVSSNEILFSIKTLVLSVIYVLYPSYGFSL